MEKKADYVLAIKKNQGKLHKALMTTCEQAKALNFNSMVDDVLLKRIVVIAELKEEDALF